ncbi:chemotaxis protein CheW [Lysobacter olei]
MNAQWVDEYVDMLLAPEAAPLPPAASAPEAAAPAAAPPEPAASHPAPAAPASPPAAAPVAPSPATIPPPRDEPHAAHAPPPAPAPHRAPLAPLARTERPASSPHVAAPSPALHHERERRADGHPAEGGGTRWLRVCVGGDSYALELLRVQEVLRPAPIVAMRGTPTWTLGVMNLRGRIVPVIDLAVWLGGRAAHASETTRIVVVERDDELIGILVSMVEDVVTLQRERRRAATAGQPGPTLIEDVTLLTPARTESSHANAARGATVGVARVGSVPTVLLDASRLFE